MTLMEGICFRRAESNDIFPLLSLYQHCLVEEPTDSVLLDWRKLEADLRSPESLWVVGEKNDRLVAALSFWMDSASGLSKIGRFLVDPEWRESEAIIRESLPVLVEYLSKKGIEVIYTTTRTISLEQQQFTLALGFKVLGIFPNAFGADPLKLNGLTAYYFGDVFKKRFRDFSLHPGIEPIFSLAQKECSLPPAKLYKGKFSEGTYLPLPQLELVHAPLFVDHRFKQLKEKHAISVDFYPFHQPNTIVTDAEQKIEIYLKVVQEGRYAAIIGERLDANVNPTELYEAVCLLLNQRNITFIEIINDAADPLALQFILEAGFIPCGYFPCFKKQGNLRRDFVVFSRSFERLVGPQIGRTEVPEIYLSYLKEYYRLDEKYQLGRS